MKALVVLALSALCIFPGCVVSTYGAPGDEPNIALPEPEPIEAEAAAPAGPAQIGARHILLAYVGSTRAAPYITRNKEEAQALAEQLRDKALSGTDFAELAREYSDDRGSAATGGDLGTFRREQMVGEFSTAAFALEVGGISQVIESQFGFHVIQRTE